MFGKSVKDLQTNVDIGDDKIAGTLKYVTGYTDFSSVSSDQSGNYLALKVDTDEDAVVTVEVVNGTKGPVTLDEDRNIVLLIKNKDTQDVKVVVSKNGQSITKVYDLSGMTLESAPVQRESTKKE